MTAGASLFYLKNSSCSEVAMTQGEAIILRILAASDYHAYQLDKLIDENRMREWADIGFSSIYSTLNKLERKHLVRSRTEAEQAGPSRRVYAITEAGRAEVRQEILRLLEAETAANDPFLVGLMLSSFLDDREFKSSLVRRREGLARKLAKFPKTVPEGTKHKERALLSLERSRRILEAELAWLKEVL
ncbi:MAG: PadR family transcriptional regulator [Myxococcales bacterium]